MIVPGRNCRALDVGMEPPFDVCSYDVCSYKEAEGHRDILSDEVQYA